ncbi:glycosyltransferase family 8 protein [Neobacillus niacini]|uniref:glycosyltransferase family 8 protein n=1 Tax=Neobacillus niacini TaxID=86668 RepID=UPI003983228D
MHIVTASNNNYAKHLGVMLTSLLENVNKDIDIHIYVIDGNISNENKSELQKVVTRFNIKLNFIMVDNDLFTSFKVNENLGYISIETYYRVIIPNILGNDVTKAIYLDCDLILRDDISKLWEVNIDNYYLAAVEDKYKKRKKVLSIPRTSIYFNAGVLLINLKKWRENNIPNQVIQFIENNPQKLKLMDQDALNAILHRNCLKLDYTWNYATGYWNQFKIDNPSIIHFTGPNKPWNSKTRYNHEYYKYLNLSKWGQGSSL